MDNTGQVAVEIILIAVVLLGLLLATAYVMVQRNNDINRISTLQRDSLKCDSIASTITSFASNGGYSEATVSGLEKNVRIEKGSVIVGDISCSYKGDVWFKEEAEEEKSAQDGFTLEIGKEYWIKKIGEKVMFFAQQ